MIGDLIAKALSKIGGISVVHSIPGRLRVRLAAGAKAKEFLQKHQEIPPTLFLYKLKGIRTIELNKLTFTALITYDTDLLNEEEITTWLRRLHELIIQSVLKGHRSVDQQHIDAIASQLTEEGYVLEKFEQGTTS